MHNFVWYNPTRIIFGEDTHLRVGAEVAKYSKNILLHYGGKSLKASGTYDVVAESLREMGVRVTELGGVKPNPRLSLVKEGIELCRREQIDFILAVGGGSVIDSAKAIAVGSLYDGDVWDFYAGGKRPERALGVGVVLTIPAAGSESSDGSVITKEDTRDKCSCGTELMYPKFAILNPKLCYTLPEHQIRAGGADILAHIMERYFVPNRNTDLSDRLCEAAMQALIQNLPKVLKERENYDAWAEVMWTGNVAHNGLLGKGREEDWASHGIEHELSAIYDIAHGAGLAIVFPAWMKYVWKKHPERFVQFGVRVFGIDTEGISPKGKKEEEICTEAIAALEDFFHGIGLPTRLRDVGIGKENFDVMAKKACRNGKLGSFLPLVAEDVKAIYELAY